MSQACSSGMDDWAFLSEKLKEYGTTDKDFLQISAYFEMSSFNCWGQLDMHVSMWYVGVV